MGISVSYGVLVLTTWWLKMTHMYSFSVPEVRNPKSTSLREGPHSLGNSRGESLSWTFLASTTIFLGSWTLPPSSKPKGQHLASTSCSHIAFFYAKSLSTSLSEGNTEIRIISPSQDP